MGQEESVEVPLHIKYDIKLNNHYVHKIKRRFNINILKLYPWLSFGGQLFNTFLFINSLINILVNPSLYTIDNLRDICDKESILFLDNISNKDELIVAILKQLEEDKLITLKEI